MKIILGKSKEQTDMKTYRMASIPKNQMRDKP